MTITSGPADCHELAPPMLPGGGPAWPGARWIGSVDLDRLAPDLPAGATIDLAPLHADGYTRARVLVRRGPEPVEFVEADIIDGRIRFTVAESAAGPVPVDSVVPTPPITVVVCTRDRPEQLRSALESVLRLDYPEFEVVVVDNASATPATADMIDGLADPRVRRVPEAVPGLSNARNAGLRAARHDIVAFTDDDVVVDPGWLSALARGFARSPKVSCVSGLVPSGELRTAAQGYFDQRVSWAESLTPRLYSMADPPADVPLFPFQVGRYGTGANFAIGRDRAVTLGGFDEALGAGTATKGGEDLDMFFRVLMAGDALANEPSAIVWHRHRADPDALLAQARGYGLGLGAWLTKVALDRDHRRLAMSVVRRRFGSTAKAGANYGAIAAPPADFGAAVPRNVGRTEVLSVLGGPRALWRGRRQGRHAAPLRGTV